MPSLWDIVVPEATTNLITNPSFETVTTGWAGGSDWTIARDTTYAKYGVSSLKGTAGATASVSMMNYAITLPTASTDYALSGWVYVPAGWDGDNISLTATDLTSSSTVVNHQYTHGTSPTDEWVYLETILTVDSDVTGDIVVLTSSAPSSTTIFYADGIQVEEKAYVTTYCDGAQDGCEWTAGAHVSTSTRSARSWQGGRVRNLADDLSVQVNGWVGTSIPQLDTNISELGLSAGGHHQSSRYRTRNWQILCQINGTSQANMHSLKRAFLAKLDPRRLGEVAGRGSPVRFRYTGSSETVYIDAFYTGGAEFAGQSGFTDIFPIRLSSPDPFFRTIGDKAKVLDSRDTDTFSHIMRKGADGQWDNMSDLTANATGSPAVVAIASEEDGTIWLGGNVSDLEGDTAWDYLALYDPVADSFSKPFTTDPDNIVNSIEIAADGTVYAGGTFTAIDGTSANRIASYNGSSWSALGTGLNGQCSVIKQGPDGRIYAGGSFTTAGGTTVRGVAAWNGSTWAAIGPPSSGGSVNDLGWDKSGNLYVVGSFTNWNGAGAADYIAKWDGSAWSAVTTPVFDASIYAIQFDAAGNFYVGGAFTQYNSATCNRVAYFNGTTFVPLSSGTNAEVFGMTIDGEGRLWIVGTFTTAGGSSLGDRIAIWDGSNFLGADIDLDGSAQMWYATYINGKGSNKHVYIGGAFDNATGEIAAVTTVTNQGSTLAYPVITVTRSGGTSSKLRYITNRTTGAELTFNYDLLDGETLTIDLRPGRRRMVSSRWGEGWKLLPTSDVANFTLAPGDNSLAFWADEAGSPTITTSILWQQTQLGLD